MLSRQLLSRGLISIRPLRLSTRSLPRHFHIQHHLLTRGRPPGVPNKTAAPKKKGAKHDLPDGPSSPPTSTFARDLARVRAERKELSGSRLKAVLAVNEEDKRRRHQDMTRLRIEEAKAETMVKPEGMTQKEFDGMTVAERMELRFDLRDIRKTHLLKKDPVERAEWLARIKKYADEYRGLREKLAAGRAAEQAERENRKRTAAGEEVNPLDCPDGINPQYWADAVKAIQERKELLLLPKGPKEPRKPSPHVSYLTPEEKEFNLKKAKAQRERWLKKNKIDKMACPPGADPEAFKKMSVEEKFKLLEEMEHIPTPVKFRRNVGHTKKDILDLTSTKTKVRSIATKTLQYRQEVARALLDAGIVGNDMDFREGTVIASADTSRMNIMSRELCDDILMRLGPSLEKHEGCDIIDINPGVGVWSSKLHDHLKPRSHILMEPDGIYTSHLAKFVEKDPTYKHVPLSGIIWQNLLKLEEDNLLPHQTRRQFGDPELDKPNDTLLVTVNLGYYPRRSYLGFASLTHLVMNQLFTASRAHSIFQAYGQIRMLVWVHDFEKRIIVPRTLNLRKKSAIEAETCSEYIREVCGADGWTEISQRSKNVNLISARRVRQRMEEAGISTPPHRTSRLEREMRVAMDEGTEQDGTLKTSWHDDYEVLKNGLAEKKFPMWEDPTTGKAQYVEDPEVLAGKGRGSLPRMPPGAEPSAVWVKWTQLRNRVTSEANQEVQIQEMTEDYEELEAKYLAITKMDIDQETKERQLNIVEQQISHWVEKVERQIDMRRRRVKQNVMESKAISLDTPILEWDRRPYEPMVTKPDEFWPRQEMALLDIQPKTLWPSLTKNGLGDYDYYDLLLSCLCHYPNKSIIERLQAFAPGADEWIIPRCAGLRDVEKGGCVDLRLLTVRNMTQEHLKEVFGAFVEWPFRPGKGRLLQMLGSTSVHEEDGEEGGGGNGKGW